jgi:hypothetical protein
MKRIFFILFTVLFLGCKPSGNCNNIVKGSDENITSEVIDNNQSHQSVLEDAFVRNRKSNDNIQAIWNLSFKVFNDKSKKSFDIGINIIKDSPLTIGNILIKGIRVDDKKIIAVDSLSIFGKKSSGSTGSIEYNSESNITFNSVELQDETLFVNLGYIMKNQTIVSQKSFQKKAYYDIKIYVSHLNLDAVVLDDAYSLQIEYDKFYTFPSKSHYLSGLIIIED